ncbi:hypothetical protein [Altericroceibacterium endophyticum]|uniref:Tetratricopeptide repeat protein n=1 Tax=Altericroceibacterium endophyticum TaxID=1808508 RepID=A0A6I4T027_9SPHN|nr:hypothetical protein [Altericroceibacterium endophyticum]MXO64424.1 hypothetical protein [Altericroceibacterium endophyticum]
MLRMSLPVRRKAHKGLGSKIAMAMALAGGTVAGAGIATPAFAQDYSKAFVKTYKPVADIVNAEGGDVASQKPNIPAVIAAIETEDDRFAAGQLILSMGSKLTDPSLQRQGLELMLASGKTPAEQVGQFQFYVGNFAYQAGDYAAAREALNAAAAAGYTDNDPEALIIESYFAEDQNKAGLDYLKQAVTARMDAGREVPDNWLLRGLKVAYENDMAAEATDIAALLAENNPTEQNWTNGLQVVRALNDFEGQEMLDVMRLMRATGSMTTQRDYIEYVEAADARRMANEVLAVLQEGEAAGLVPADEPFFNDAKSTAQERAASDREGASELLADAQSADTGVTALGAADLFMSFDDYANAEKMYALAVEKGGVDKNRALTREGIAQAMQGESDAARATLQQVTGNRAPIAEMWIAYVDANDAPAAPAPAATPATAAQPEG